MESLRKTLEKTLQFYEQKDYQSAEKGADEMLAAYPEFNRALFLKGVILEETGRSGKAEEYYKKTGGVSLMWLRLALQLQDGDPERALRYFKKVNDIDQENNLIWLSMGKIYEKTGRIDEAKKCYGRMNVVKEALSKLLSPLGFLIIMIAGSIAMFKRDNAALASLVVASGVVCLLWLKRDATRVLEMVRKKRMAS
jgi:Tfp pilus assembly protein PilF